MTRTRNSIKNVVTSASGHVFQIILQFMCRTVFIRMLSTEYLGLNGLFSNILSVLSLAEMGFGTALLYSMYKPIHEDDREKIIRLVNLYRKIYVLISIVIATMGLFLLPFLKYLIRDYEKYNSLENLYLIYFLYLANTLLSYIYIYKKSVIEAYQKNYIYIFIQKSFLIVQNLFQICVLLIWKNFLLYLLIQITITISTNIVISVKADKIFPFLKLKNRDFPSKEEKRKIYKNVKAMAMHKVGAVVFNSTDNIILSSLISLWSVGIYSNYLLILSHLDGFIELIFKSVTSSVGDLGASSNKQRLESVFYILTFIEFWVYSFSAICLYILLNPFIKVWIGEEYTFSLPILFVLVLNFYLKGMRVVINIFRDSLGLFWYDRFKPLFEIMVNLIFSLLLANYYGIIGVFLGTLISYMLLGFWIEPIIIYKYALGKNPLKYFVLTLKYFIITIVMGALFSVICSYIKEGVVGILLKFSILIFYNVLILLMFRRTNEFKEVMEVLRKVLKKG